MPHVPHILKRLLPGTFQDQVQITKGTALAEAGVDLAVIQALLGHVHVDSSVGYIHLAPVRVRAAYDQARQVQRAQA
jgi:site-specific recombinase XerC